MVSLLGPPRKPRHLGGASSPKSHAPRGFELLPGKMRRVWALEVGDSPNPTDGMWEINFSWEENWDS